MQAAFVDTQLKEFLNNKNITAPIDLDSFVQPASIDIPIGDTAYLVKHAFLPFAHTISELTQNLLIDTLSLDEGAVLLRGQTYLIKCLDLNLPKNVVGRVSPKSSVGRIDLMVRAIVDGSGLYDIIPQAAKGELWLVVSPQSFNVRVQTGLPLSQLRIFAESEVTYVKPDPTDILGETYDPKSNVFTTENTLSLSLDVPAGQLIGYEARNTNEIIDMSRRDHESKLFFRPVFSSESGEIILEKDHFYILATREKISVPKEYSVEMHPSAANVGELRAHYAGFFDPGFGIPHAATGVLEIRPHETLTVYDGQPICMLDFFMNQKTPGHLYGDAGNNYQGQQGPRLAKFFAPLK